MTLTRDRKSELLAGARLFDGVDADGMERIAAVAVEVDFPADHVIARQGEIGTGFFVVVERRGPGRPRWRDDRDARPGRLLRGAVGARRAAADRPVVADGPTTCLALADLGFRGGPRASSRASPSRSCASWPAACAT